MRDSTGETVGSDECPAWCGGTHAAGAHPDDQHHASRPRRIALITGSPTLEHDDLAVATAVVARLVRRTRSEVTWLEVVSEEGQDLRMVATLDSARRLLTVLGELLSLTVT